ncbi:Bug family tripartite tricarboxylate transporter substrate binding protein [Zeimonas arvi]|uniref:Tripartite tricarboxylate transporter substrate binding protein n=1 Tax=Zeimonas arvi TaxID=2498847 RepID=A0A5C8NU89_9BURK|nr:tripartite tricarboxylate transporter substrate binding protein [Zeimonas arvi]TXL64721.1 tripartite tricarboxylate transporter substrate binding protein [Zeimonas arvi]
MKRRTLVMGGVLAALSIATSPSMANDWPAKPVRLIVPYPAGGNSDHIARFIGERVGQAIGQPIVVENRAGAGATIGAQAAASAPADGYTFLLAPTAVVAITPHLRKVPYDPADLTPIAKVSGSYGMAVARKDLPANDFKELVELARKSPGKLTFGSAGTATITHLIGEIVNMKAGIKTLHVPYKGSAPALNDLIGGQIDLIYDSVALTAIKAGQAKPLAATGKYRHPELPDVPTTAELGYPMDTSSWFGLFAPKGTPAAVVDRMSAEVQKALADPAAKSKMEAFSQYPDYENPAQFAKTVAADSAMFKALISTAGIKVD